MKLEVVDRSKEVTDNVQVSSPYVASSAMVCLHARYKNIKILYIIFILMNRMYKIKYD